MRMNNMRQAKQKSGPLSWLFLIIVITASALLLFGAARQFYRAAYPIKHEEIILRESEKNGRSPALVYAVIRTESGFDPAAVSSVKARGLMQITPDTFEWIRGKLNEDNEIVFEDLYGIEENIRYGTALLGMHLAELGSERNALCAYHAGRSKALEWLRDPACAPDGETIENIPYGDTSRYVEKVLRTKETYEELYGSFPS
jgi:soluble lytic murein transglycosylase